MEDQGAPERLFKYLSPARIGILTDRLVRYTSLGAFNDPFEGRPEIKGIASKEAALASFAEILTRELDGAYNDLPPALKAQFSRKHWAQLAIPFIQQQQGQFLAMLNAVSNQLIPTIPVKMDEILGVLSLCEIPDSLLMWAHYGMSHTGFVLELDPRHPYFNARRTDQDEFGMSALVPRSSISTEQRCSWSKAKNGRMSRSGGFFARLKMRTLLLM